MSAEVQDGGWRANRWRILGWSLAAGLLLLPLVAMQFTPEVNWDETDFIFMAILIGGVGLGFELMTRRSASRLYRAASAVALGTVFFLIWSNAAVGIIGSEDNPANSLYDGVVLVAVVGALLARLRPGGMVLAMAATALAMAVVPIIALTTGQGIVGPVDPGEVLGVTLVFVALWSLSAVLFRLAARELA